MPSLTFSGDDQTTDLVAAISLPDGDTDVRVSGFKSTETISRLYSYELHFTLTSAVPAADLVGAQVSVGLRARIDPSAPPKSRYFHGVINRFSYLGEIDAPGAADGTESRYVAEIVPPLWFLTQSTHCRIFQDKTIPEIVAQVLGDHEITSTTNFQATFPTHNYRVQYRESDFAFISRLLEEAGIYYYFQPDAEATQLVLSDKLNGWFACEEPTMRYGGTSAHIQSWKHDYQFVPDTYEHRDFNFEEPSAAVAAAISSVVKFPLAPASRVFENVGGFLENAVGEVLARLRMEEEEATSELISGTSQSPCLIPGATFALSQHPLAAENNVERCIKRVKYEVTGTTNSLAGSFGLTCKFTCFSSATQFRPRRKTPRPHIPGPQTATVTTSGDRIQVDRYGRVKVQFHWDEEGTNDDNSSCWIRVSQGWAGDGYGSVLLPHQGQEVVVSFLEGDPDQPLITGRVYNSNNMPPETLPDKKDRAIVAWDHKGNYIALDADEERVDINNASDKFEYTVGMSASATLGLDFGITVGSGVGINVGAAVGLALASSFDVAAGWSTSIAFGGTWGASFGSDFTYAKGRYVNAGDSLGQIAFKAAADFVSQDSVTLAGGSGANNSVVSCNTTALTLSYGTTDPTFADVSGTAIALGMLGTSLLGTIGVGAGAASAVLAGSAAEADDATGLAIGSAACGVAGVTAAAAATVLTALFAKRWVPMQQKLHQAPLSSLTLNSSTAALYAGPSGRAHVTGQIVDLNAISAINARSQLNVDGNLSVTGSINGVNLQDLGNPAAAAAAAAAAASARAALESAQAAAAAAQTAERAAAVAAAEAEPPPA
jgi:type VI secretion system secreted protein VgrG